MIVHSPQGEKNEYAQHWCIGYTAEHTARTGTSRREEDMLAMHSIRSAQQLRSLTPACPRPFGTRVHFDAWYVENQAKPEWPMT